VACRRPAPYQAGRGEVALEVEQVARRHRERGEVVDGGAVRRASGRRDGARHAVERAPLLQPIGHLDRGALPLSAHHHGEPEARQRRFGFGGGVGASSHEGHAGQPVAQARAEVARAGPGHREKGQPDQLGLEGHHAFHEVGLHLRVAVEHVHLVAGRPQRARDVEQPQRREHVVPLVVLDVDEADPHDRTDADGGGRFRVDPIDARPGAKNLLRIFSSRRPRCRLTGMSRAWSRVTRRRPASCPSRPTA